MKKIRKYFLYTTEPSNPINGFEYCSISKFSKFKSPNIDELFVADLIDNVPANQKDQLVKDIKSKLKTNGILYVQSLDRYASAASILNKQIDNNFLNTLLFANNRKTLSCMSEIVQLLNKHGFIIEQSKFINGIQYFIKARASDNE